MNLNYLKKIYNKMKKVNEKTKDEFKRFVKTYN